MSRRYRCRIISRYSHQNNNPQDEQEGRCGVFVNSPSLIDAAKNQIYALYVAEISLREQSNDVEKGCRPIA